MDVKIGSVAPFDMGGMREKAIKPLEEAAEVFVAWQDIDRMSATFCSVDEVSAETMCVLERDLMDEIADCIQACANLAAAVGVSDLTPYMERCEDRQQGAGPL